MIPALWDYIIRIEKYVRYWLICRFPQKGIAQSQFISDVVQQVFRNQEHYTDYDLIHLERRKMLRSKIRLPVNIYGANAAKHAENRTLRDVVRKSSVSGKLGKLLYRMTKYHKPSVIIELGTSTGLSTLYLAMGYPDAEVITIEGNSILYGIASDVFRYLHLEHIKIVNTTFEDGLALFSHDRMKRVLVFIDGDHTYEATRKYFEYFISKAIEPVVMVFHDIYWSRDMNKIWQEIKSDPKVKTTVDLYYLGIVYNFRHLKKQNFVLWY